MASCIGNDELGKETTQILQDRNVLTEYIQFHSNLSTGKVIATIDESGDAKYAFDTPSSWDNLELTEDLRDAVSSASVVVMGSIAGRLGAKSASTLSAIRNMHGNVIFDVNLRPPWFEPKSVLDLARGDGTYPLALLKVNDEELGEIEEWVGISSNETLENRMKNLARTLNSKRVCVTRGENGAVLWCDEVFVECNGYPRLESSDESDTVGAGDSFLAALIRSLFIEKEVPDVALRRGCALGAYVASCKGATPRHEDAPDYLKDVFSFIL